MTAAERREEVAKLTMDGCPIEDLGNGGNMLRGSTRITRGY